MKSNADVISKVIDFIEEHLTDDLYLEKIADSAFYSKYHLHRMFVDIVGCTLHQYIQKRRLTEAAWQLVYTDKSIIDISLIAGYETQQSFTLAFKKLYDKSPKVYRKKKDYQSIQLKYENRKVEYSSYTKLNMRCGGKAA
ncbi:AraC family transcriptional regulator [Clostridium gelidum]|uniref:AraC family transcriptional regulator n=1 Tax=Clostridium gelidum TaxID=704125 RepID=A0ABN6ITS2_9CLOT|nr:AraC family transcriptional regulator [Clostridium gelidum]BCZ45595.1 AraC family transcriptional regulator [Clostridium gelidum]